MRAFIFTVGVLTAVSGVALGEETIASGCPGRPVDEKQCKKLAGEWFSKGESFIAEKKYVDALGAFNCSRRMVEHPATINNAAKAAELAGEKQQALDLYIAYLKEAPDGNKAQESQLRVTVLERDIEAMAAAQQDTTVVPAPEEPLEDEASEEEVDEAEERNLVLPGYITLGAGGAAIVVGAILQGTAAKAKNDGEETTSYDAFKDLESKMTGRQVGAVVSFVVGGLAVGAGIVLVVLDAKGEHTEATAYIAPAPGGLVAGGTF